MQKIGLPPKKYFFVSFSHLRGIGNTYAISNDKGVLSLQALKKNIQEDCNLFEVVIINFFEISEQQYQNRHN